MFFWDWFLHFISSRWQNINKYTEAVFNPFIVSFLGNRIIRDPAPKVSNQDRRHKLNNVCLSRLMIQNRFSVRLHYNCSSWLQISLGYRFVFCVDDGPWRWEKIDEIKLLFKLGTGFLWQGFFELSFIFVEGHSCLKTRSLAFGDVMRTEGPSTGPLGFFLPNNYVRINWMRYDGLTWMKSIIPRKSFMRAFWLLEFSCNKFILY